MKRQAIGENILLTMYQKSLASKIYKEYMHSVPKKRKKKKKKERKERNNPIKNG